MNRSAGIGSGYREHLAWFLSRRWSEVEWNRHLFDSGDSNRSSDGSSARSLGFTDPSVFEELAPPHAPWLRTIKGCTETVLATRALRTDRLGALNVDVLLGEEQVGERSVAVAAAQWRQDEFVLQFGECDGHGGSFPLLRLASRRRSWGEMKKAAGFSQRPLGDLRREICLRREPQEALSGALRKALVIGCEGCHCVAPHRGRIYARVSTNYA